MSIATEEDLKADTSVNTLGTSGSPALTDTSTPEITAENIRSLAKFRYEKNPTGDGVLYFGNNDNIIYSKREAKLLAWYDLNEILTLRFENTDNTLNNITRKFRVFEFLNGVYETELQDLLAESDNVSFGVEKLYVSAVNLITAGYRECIVSPDGKITGGQKKLVIPSLRISASNVLSFVNTVFDNSVRVSSNRNGLVVDSFKYGVNSFIDYSTLNTPVEIKVKGSHENTANTIVYKCRVIDLVLDTVNGLFDNKWYKGNKTAMVDAVISTVAYRVSGTNHKFVPDDFECSIRKGSSSVSYYRFVEGTFSNNPDGNANHDSGSQGPQNTTVSDDNTWVEQVSANDSKTAQNASVRSQSLLERWRQVREDYKNVLNKFSSYETDVWLAITYPAFNDVKVEETAAMVRAMKACERFFARSELVQIDEAISSGKVKDLPESNVYAQYASMVDDFSLAINVAERKAKQLADSNLTEKEKSLLSTARGLLAHAQDPANSEDMRANYYRQLKKTIDKLNADYDVIPTRIVAEIEHEARLLITDGSERFDGVFTVENMASDSGSSKHKIINIVNDVKGKVT